MPIKHLVALSCALVLTLVGCGGASTGTIPAPSPCLTIVPGSSGSPSPVASPCVIRATERPTPSVAPSATGSSETWDGDAELTSTAVYPNDDTCTDGWKLAFQFGVDAAGTVRGRGTADLTSPPVCPFMVGVDPAALSWRHIEYTVTGLRSASDVTLKFALESWEPDGSATMAGLAATFEGPLAGRGAPVTIPTTAGRGRGPVKWQFRSGNPPATYTTSGTMTITCGTCR